MISDIVEYLNDKVETGSYSGSGRFLYRDTSFRLGGWSGHKWEVVFVVQSSDGATDRGEYVFHFVSNNEGEVAFVLKLFSNARASKYKEIGFDVVGKVLAIDDAFLLVRDDCRYPFKINLMKLILHSCGLETEYDDEFLNALEYVKVCIKELTEVK